MKCNETQGISFGWFSIITTAINCPYRYTDLITLPVLYSNSLKSSGDLGKITL